MTINSVRRDIEELDRYLGLKLAVAFEPFEELHTRRQHTQLCMAIGAQMGLPNAVRLTIVSPSASAPGHQRFTTTALSKTDASGRGTHGIVAQVTIPADLPMYGTAAFKAHVIDVRLSPGFETMPPHTLVTLLAHELAHVLLHALRHPQRDSEQFTDLVPLVAGFGDIVKQGRVVRKTEHRGNEVHTSTVTYGYLTGEEIGLAREIVRNHVVRRRERHRAVALFVARLAQRVEAATTSLGEIRGAVVRLDETRQTVPRRFAKQVVDLHTPGLLDGHGRALAAISRTVKGARMFSDGLVLYSRSQMDMLERLRAECAQAGEQLVPIEQCVRTYRRAVNLTVAPSDKLRLLGDWCIGRLRRLLRQHRSRRSSNA